MPRNPSRRTFLKSSALIGLVPHVVPDTAFSDASSAGAVNETGLVFLFQGDSITDGNRGRNADPNHIMGHGYAFSVASRIGADFPERDFAFYNRGVSGNKITDLQKRWQTDTLDLKPDVLSILIGINDTAATISKPAEATTLEQFETIYRSLLEESRRSNPDVLFVLGIPFVYPVGKRTENWERWRDDTANRQAVVRKLAAEYNAVVVDYPAVLDKAIAQKKAEYWVWDGIHPTVFAHELMAREWIKQVSFRLKFLKKYRHSF
ncbi:SGNH/GDSL hydrolase family protein [Spirosoma endophyticum]|uniref:Lysophospholipase L1 n=1 Tax=Spirosoma endophyticum TaxID=662367 RepID=A0A1I1L0D2_9BACT|nr:SGNH/GDSL hydrolase family protein [Spirosoma endophyticum]SFC66494.1 Lysophospholipase L1 [Spirosoma endophyticum]